MYIIPSDDPKYLPDYYEKMYKLHNFIMNVPNGIKHTRSEVINEDLLIIDLKCIGEKLLISPIDQNRILVTFDLLREFEPGRHEYKYVGQAPYILGDMPVFL